MSVLTSVQLLYVSVVRNFSIHFLTNNKSNLFKILQTITNAVGYELKDIMCHDILEETVDVHQRWPFSPMQKGGSCFDKHG